MTRFVSVALALILAAPLASQPPAPQYAARSEVGPGTEITRDFGYWNAPKDRGGRWVPLPMTVVVVGHETAAVWKTLRRAEPFYVCVKKGDRFPYGEFFIVDPATLLRKDVARFVKGKREPVDSNVSFRYESPEGQ
jgi:hypothetical protein